MNKRFQIGDFLVVEGEGLTSKLTGSAQSVSGFSRLTLQDGTVVVEFEAGARASVSRPDERFPVESTVRFQGGDVESGGSATRVELKKNKNAFLSFHWPNPLTPHGSGLWIRLAIVRIDDGYQLSFVNNTTLPDHGFGFFFQDQAWQEFFLSKDNNAIPLSAWKDFRLDVLTVKAAALAAGPLLNGAESALVDKASSRSWTFQWRFALSGKDAQNRVAFRPIAMVQDGKPGESAEEVAVSSRVLRLKENPEIQPRPFPWRRTIQLSCASLRAGTAAEPSAWYVDWTGVPTADATAGLSLRGFWQDIARHWALGLRSLRSRNSLTFFPTDLRAGDPALAPMGAADAPPWTFRFRVEPGSASWKSRLEAVGSQHLVPLRFDLASAPEVAGNSSGFDSLVESANLPVLAAILKPSANLFDVYIGPSQNPLGELLVGGIRLEIRKLVEAPVGERETRSRLQVAFADNPFALGQPPITVDLLLSAAGGLPQPASEDPERGFETENDLLGRERPLVIDLNPASSLTALTIREQADPTRSRVLNVTVRAGSQSIVLDSDVVVLDPGPFLVARVLARTQEVQSGQILAVYQDDGEQPAGWELLTDTGAMTLVLPPQAIGEEMIKGLLTVDDGGHRRSVPFTGVPFDFRLSPPARLALDRTDVDTARTAAPWTLRRLLDRREGVTGLKLDGAEFELLYGLAGKLEGAQGLRVAEQEAFVGRVPLSPALRDRLPGRSTAEIPPDVSTYASSVVGWIRGLMARPAQLPVFRDFAARERLTLTEGLSLELRESRQTANPLAIDRYHPRIQDTDEVADWDTEQVRPPGRDGGRKPLRGGVDYPFESRNIYGAVLDKDRAKIGKKGEAQARVAGLVFGALGGSGSQQATFDEGRTLIISETAQGRLSSLTLVRVGRISMLWHHARHIIVYERTTRTVPRYKDLQPEGFEGLAALRKVREYIEIMQPRRGYPDFGDPAASGDGPPLAGPLTAGFFETTVIPVKPDWGHDIDGGWVVALRGPLTPDEADFYPFPKIFLELARAAGKGEGTVSHLLADPSQLLFFTTTRQGLGGDSDAWPPWPDIDLPLTQRPQPPKVPFLPSFSGTSRQPDAADHDYGQRRFTLDVVPAEEAVNLLHGRPGLGLEARVRNVSLVRGRVPDNVRSRIDETVGRVFAESEARIGDGLAELAQHLERLVQEGAGKTVGETAGLREQALELLKAAYEDADALRGAVDAAETLLKEKVETWDDLQKRRQADARNELDKALTGSEGYKDQLLGALDGVLKRLPAGIPGPDWKVESEARLRNALEAVCRQVRQRLESTPFLPAEALGLLEAELKRDEEDLKDFILGLRTGLLNLVDQMEARFALADPEALRQDLIAALLAARARIVALGAGFVQQVKARLGPLFGDLPGDGKGAIGRLTGAIDRAVTLLTGKIDEAVRNLPEFTIQPPDWAQIKNSINAIEIGEESLFVEVRQALVAPLKAKVEEWQAGIKKEIEALEDGCREKGKDLIAALGQGVEVLEGVVAGVVDGWVREVRQHADALAQEATTRFNDLEDQIKDLEGALTQRAQVVEQQVVAKIRILQHSLEQATKDLSELAAEAQDAVRQAGTALRRIGEDVERAVVTELRDRIQNVESAALELTRAVAEGPVTDTLRCTRDWVGYYYNAARDVLDVTRAAGVFNNLGSGVLNSLSAQVPFDRIRDRLLPQLADFDLNKLFPDFAGLKLENLLGGLKIPSDPLAEYDWIKVRHGFDRDRLTAWSEVVIDKRFDSDPELFSLPPVSLLVERPRFTARSRIEASQAGVQAQQTEARLVADWAVTLNGEPIMTIAGGGLYYDGGNGFRFDFEAQNLRLAPVLQFVTDAFSSLLPADQGLTLTPLFPGGLSVELSLPLPDIGTGAFTMTGITLYTHFDLLVAGGFELRTGLWLSRPNRPFGLAVLFLGGGGWFGVDVRYKPPQDIETRVSVGVSAGAFVTLNFGVAHGSAGILLTAGLDFYRKGLQGGTQDLAISIGLLVWGEFNILAIVSAYLRMILRVEYRNGEMNGYGTISLSIKICWCFTLRVEEQIRLPFASQGGRGGAAARALAPSPRPTVREAVTAHFANLDL